jgi:uncharacterized phage infection (PIP) family protein YhgE
VARFLPLTYAVAALRAAMRGDGLTSVYLDLLVLVGFTITLLGLAVRVLARRMA